MRWLAFIATILVLLFWQYQKSLQSQTLAEVTKGAQIDAVENKQDAKEPLSPSLPTINNEENWLQPELKSLFDHFLIEYEQDLDAMWLAFAQHCDKHLDPCQQITDLFQRYVAYKKALVAIDENAEESLSQVTQRLAALAELRHEFFAAEEIIVLFGDERQWQQTALERLAIRQNETLSLQQKQELLALHYASLEGLARRSVAPSLQLEKVSQLATAQALALTNYNELAAEFGPEAADRLIAAADKQKAWQRKVAQFQTEKQKLQQELTGEELMHAVQSLKQQMFEPNELKRLKVILSS